MSVMSGMSTTCAHLAAAGVFYLTATGEHIAALNGADGPVLDLFTLDPVVPPQGGPRHARTPVEAAGRVNYLDTKSLVTWVRPSTAGPVTAHSAVAAGQPNHPVTGRPFDAAELRLMLHYWECLQYASAHPVLEGAEAFHFAQFVQQNGELGAADLKMARILLHPRDFADHFRDYTPQTDMEKMTRFERMKATQFLSAPQTPASTWLLRHSSLNRPLTPAAAGDSAPMLDSARMELNQRLGLEFYCFSYRANGPRPPGFSVHHMLIVHRPGRGWCLADEAVYRQDSVVLKLERSVITSYSLCFVDLIIALTTRFHTPIRQHTGDYLTVGNSGG